MVNLVDKLISRESCAFFSRIAYDLIRDASVVIPAEIMMKDPDWSKWPTAPEVRVS